MEIINWGEEILELRIERECLVLEHYLYCRIHLYKVSRYFSSFVKLHFVLALI